MKVTTSLLFFWFLFYPIHSFTQSSQENGGIQKNDVGEDERKNGIELPQIKSKTLEDVPVKLDYKGLRLTNLADRSVKEVLRQIMDNNVWNVLQDYMGEMVLAFIAGGATGIVQHAAGHNINLKIKDKNIVLTN